MTLQAYQVALADLRKWHEGDRFQRHFDDIEAHVNALSTPLQGVSDAEPLPAPTSILLTRDAEGRLLNPTTGEPFTIVIHTTDGNREVTHITFAGERDVPIKLPDPVYVDAENSVSESGLVAAPAATVDPEKAEAVFAAVRDALDLSDVAQGDDADASDGDIANTADTETPATPKRKKRG